jgi:hypothetical protein
VSPRTRPASPEEAQKIAAHARQHLACDDCGTAPGEPCNQPGGRIVCKARYIAAANAVRQQAREARQAPDQAPEHAAVLASLPRVSWAEIEKCRTPRGGYSFTKAWFLEHGLPYPPVAGWRKAVDRDDDKDSGTAGAQAGMPSETLTALKNYDHLIRSHGLDDVLLDWATDSLAYGDGAVLIEELARPGFTPATGGVPDERDDPGEVPLW